MGDGYVHGYAQRENTRLRDQATALTELLHDGTTYPEGATVLEAGCGVGAQTIALARRSPTAIITSIDISEASLTQARESAHAARVTNATFLKADIYDLPFCTESFDHVFVCFVLEHVERPVVALQSLKTVLKPGGTITVVEGDHGSAYFHPDSESARRAIDCLVELQRRIGGNALIGRQLYPLLREAGFDAIRVSPRVAYVDASRPDLVDGITRRTFTAMIEGVREGAIASGMIEAAEFDRGIAHLNRLTNADAVFCYTFFKATAISVR
jgi:SAM-dependent methyltransferase